MTIIQNKCKGCGLCVFYCPAHCLEMSGSLNKRGVKFVQMKKNANCTQCGICFVMCPDACIEIGELAAV